MNLIQGRPVPQKYMPRVLAALPKALSKTLEKPPLKPQLVVDACDALVHSLQDADVLPILVGLGMGEKQAAAQLATLRAMFSREYLTQRLQTELGAGYLQPATRAPYTLGKEVTEQQYPLGVLLHIAAGNMDGLPIYSVIEGLLCGNINLLKLPSVDGGLSVLLAKTLLDIQPALREYVYVFELSSTETDNIAALAALSHGIVVWGGDEAVRAVRGMAPPSSKIIEWGHKLSFAYVTKGGMAKAKLNALAHNICATNSLLCSSCQGVYVDTSDAAVLQGFCEAFLPVLETVARQYPPVPLSATAQNTLRLHARGLEGIYPAPAKIYRGSGVSLVLEEDPALTPSLQFRSVWVKPLPKADIVPVLWPHKSHLQTAALLCSEKEWQPLRDILWRAGLVRIAPGQEMNDTYCGAAHDGEHPLRRYTRIVSAQK